MNKSALLLVDLQNDFCPGGALAVEEGDEVIPIANQWLKEETFDKIIATQDWHPQDHLSFASNHENHNPGDIITLQGLEQILWPDHCIQNTRGADFHPQLNTSKIDKIIQKGTNPLYDSYSAFFDNGHHSKTELDGYLFAHQIQRLFILGLATDYCVKYTVLDARELGYEVYLILDGCRGVNLSPNDSNDAITLMENRGAILV